MFKFRNTLDTKSVSTASSKTIFDKKIIFYSIFVLFMLLLTSNVLGLTCTHGTTRVIGSYLYGCSNNTIAREDISIHVRETLSEGNLFVSSRIILFKSLAIRITDIPLCSTGSYKQYIFNDTTRKVCDNGGNIYAVIDHTNIAGDQRVYFFDVANGTQKLSIGYGWCYPYGNFGVCIGNMGRPAYGTAYFVQRPDCASTTVWSENYKMCDIKNQANQVVGILVRDTINVRIYNVSALDNVCNLSVDTNCYYDSNVTDMVWSNSRESGETISAILSRSGTTDTITISYPAAAQPAAAPAPTAEAQLAAPATPAVTTCKQINLSNDARNYQQNARICDNCLFEVLSNYAGTAYDTFPDYDITNIGVSNKILARESLILGEEEFAIGQNTYFLYDAVSKGYGDTALRIFMSPLLINPIALGANSTVDQSVSNIEFSWDAGSILRVNGTQICPQSDFRANEEKWWEIRYENKVFILFLYDGFSNRLWVFDVTGHTSGTGTPAGQQADLDTTQIAGAGTPRAGSVQAPQACSQVPVARAGACPSAYPTKLATYNLTNGSVLVPTNDYNVRRNGTRVDINVIRVPANSCLNQTLQDGNKAMFFKNSSNQERYISFVNATQFNVCGKSGGTASRAGSATGTCSEACNVIDTSDYLIKCNTNTNWATEVSGGNTRREWRCFRDSTMSEGYLISREKSECGKIYLTYPNIAGARASGFPIYRYLPADINSQLNLTCNDTTCNKPRNATGSGYDAVKVAKSSVTNLAAIKASICATGTAVANTGAAGTVTGPPQIDVWYLAAGVLYKAYTSPAYAFRGLVGNMLSSYCRGKTVGTQLGSKLVCMSCGANAPAGATCGVPSQPNLGPYLYPKCNGTNLAGRQNCAYQNIVNNTWQVCSDRNINIGGRCVNPCPAAVSGNPWTLVTGARMNCAEIQIAGATNTLVYCDDKNCRPMCSDVGDINSTNECFVETSLAIVPCLDGNVFFNGACKPRCTGAASAATNCFLKTGSSYQVCGATAGSCKPVCTDGRSPDGGCNYTDASGVIQTCAENLLFDLQTKTCFTSANTCSTPGQVASDCGYINRVGPTTDICRKDSYFVRDGITNRCIERECRDGEGEISSVCAYDDGSGWKVCSTDEVFSEGTCKSECTANEPNEDGCFYADANLDFQPCDAGRPYLDTTVAIGMQAGCYPMCTIGYQSPNGGCAYSRDGRDTLSYCQATYWAFSNSRSENVCTPECMSGLKTEGNCSLANARGVREVVSRGRIPVGTESLEECTAIGQTNCAYIPDATQGIYDKCAQPRVFGGNNKCLSICNNTVTGDCVFNSSTAAAASWQTCLQETDTPRKLYVEQTSAGVLNKFCVPRCTGTVSAPQAVTALCGFESVAGTRQTCASGVFNGTSCTQPVATLVATSVTQCTSTTGPCNAGQVSCNNTCYDDCTEFGSTVSNQCRFVTVNGNYSLCPQNWYLSSSTPRTCSPVCEEGKKNTPPGCVMPADGQACTGVRFGDECVAECSASQPSACAFLPASATAYQLCDAGNVFVSGKCLKLCSEITEASEIPDRDASGNWTCAASISGNWTAMTNGLPVRISLGTSHVSLRPTVAGGGTREFQLPICTETRKIFCYISANSVWKGVSGDYPLCNIGATPVRSNCYLLGTSGSILQPVRIDNADLTFQS